MAPLWTRHLHDHRDDDDDDERDHERWKPDWFTALVALADGAG